MYTQNITPLNKKPNPNLHKINWDKWETVEIAVKLKETGNCRYCKHSFYYHVKQDYNVATLGSCRYKNDDLKAVDPFSLFLNIPVLSHNSFCPCFEYVPGENLAYLEWKNKKDKNNVQQEEV